MVVIAHLPTHTHTGEPLPPYVYGRINIYGWVGHYLTIIMTNYNITVRIRVGVFVNTYNTMGRWEGHYRCTCMSEQVGHTFWQKA